MNQMAAGQKMHLRTYPTLILTRSDVYCRRHASSRPWLRLRPRRDLRQSQSSDHGAVQLPPPSVDRNLASGLL